ncbi:23352_t:CDS:2, partial [Gigaspora rosea]
ARIEENSMTESSIVEIQIEENRMDEENQTGESSVLRDTRRKCKNRKEESVEQPDLVEFETNLTDDSDRERQFVESVFNVRGDE